MNHIFNALKKTLLVIVLFTFGALNVFAQTTYTVTSTSITGIGSFTAAIDSANANPGADTIEFTPGLQVNARASLVTTATSIMSKITESVVIDGKGAALNGEQTWIGAGGILNSLSDCPGDVSGTIQLAYMPGFVAIGTLGADNSAIDVTIKNLTIRQFNQVAEIYKNASLVLENFKAYDTFSTFDCLGDVMINAREGVSLTITDSKFSNAENWSLPESSASIYGSNAADLTIERSTFGDLCQREQPAIYWDGASGTEVNIVSSRIVRSGGIRISGASVSNIVNSIWVNYYIQVPRIGDLIRNYSSGDMNIIASSFEWNSNECDGLCQSNGYQNLFEIKGAGNINFSQSAVGFNWDPATGADELNTLGINGGTGSFTADVYTWIQSTTQQDAVALKAMTSQSALLTDLFGFNRGVFGVTGDYDVEMVTPAGSGELIDVIPSGTPLINPIDGSTITLDVVGNPREDANGERNIGAVQLALSPFLAVDTTGNGFVTLVWTEPIHHDGFPIIRYEVEYDVSGGSSPTNITIDPPVLNKTISGLTNGTAYEFKVRAIYDDSGTEENGPFSNTVTDTPYGLIDPPVVTATRGNTEVGLSWNQPDLKGNRFLGYIIQWGEVAPFWEGSQYIMDYNTTSITVSGLTGGTEYVFSVKVNSLPTPSLGGTTTATPYGPIAAPVVTAVPGDTEVALSWNQPDLKGNTFLGYIIQWGEFAPFWEGFQVIKDINTLSTTVSGLTSGTEYVFSVKVNSLPLPSLGGTATATPYGPLEAPVVTAVPGDSEVALSWTQPDLGGRVFDTVAYRIQWRVQGTPDFSPNFGINNPSQTNITVIGLTNGTTYEFRVTVSASGDTNQGSTTARAFESIPPEAKCQDIGITLDREGRARIYPGFIDNGSTDAGGIVSYVLDRNKFYCSDIGENTVVMSVKDVSGNISTCSAVVTISDNWLPEVTCKDIEVSLGTTGVAVIDSSMITDAASSICGIATIEVSQSEFTAADLGDNTVTLTATNLSGISSTCEAKVTVKDEISPVAKCNSIDVWLSDSATYELTADDIKAIASGSSDNASTYDSLQVEITPTTFDCSQVGDSVKVEVSITDQAGNESTCETMVYVHDSTQILLNSLDAIEINLASGICETTIDYPEVFTGKPCVTFTQLEGLGADSIFPVGTTLETWEVDYGTEKDTVSFAVIVTLENVVPTIDSIADVTGDEDSPLSVSLQGISGGNDCTAQDVSVTASNQNAALVTAIEVVYTAGDTLGQLNLTLAANASGTDSLTVVVEDSEGGKTSKTFKLTVNPINDAPYILLPLADGTVNASKTFELPLTELMGVVFGDIDDDTLAFDVKLEGTDTLPDWANTADGVLTAIPMLADMGTYWFVVTATDTSGAMASDTFKLEVEGYPTAIDDMGKGVFELTMYPNPTKALVTVETSATQTAEVEVAVMNIAGAEVFRKEYRTGELLRFDMSEEVSGIYLVIIEVDGQRVVKKLILDRK